MECKKVGRGYMVVIKAEGKTLTRANPDWGGTMGTQRTAEGVQWRYFPTLEEALADAEFGPLVQAGEAWWKGVRA